jgi:integrase
VEAIKPEPLDLTGLPTDLPDLEGFNLPTDKDFKELQIPDLEIPDTHLDLDGLPDTHLEIDIPDLPVERPTPEAVLRKTDDTVEVIHRDKDRRAYTLNNRQINALFEAIKTSNKNGLKVTGVRDQMVVRILLDTGARISEVLALTVGDLDLVEGTLHIRESKSGRGRTLALPNGTLFILEKHWLPIRQQITGSAYLFPVIRATSSKEKYRKDNEGNKVKRTRKATKGQALSTNGFRASFNRYVKASGLDRLSFKVTPHTLRHTFASHYLKDSGSVKDLQYILGHRNLETTFLYLHSFDPDVIRRMKNRKPIYSATDLSDWQRFVKNEI